MAQVQSQDVGFRGFYSLDQVLERIPISRSTVYRLMKEGKFPKSARITRQRLGWSKTEIDAHLEELLAKAAA
jgi:prophage regulatory protein